MSAKFELKKSGSGQFYFNLKASNGEIILSSEMYTAKASAETGIESVKGNAPDENRYDRKTSQNGEWYFVLKARNGAVIGKSEMYTSAQAMENGIESVRHNAPDARVSDMTEQSRSHSSS